MTPRRAFVRKEFSEYMHTWRLLTMVAPVMLFAIANPLLVYFSPEILGVTLDSYENINITVTDPSWIDSYKQWTDSLKQIVPLLLIVIAITAVSGEVTSGTVIPILTGGLSRRDFVLIKYGVNAIFAISVITVGTLIVWLVSNLLFAETSLKWALAIVGIASLLMLVLIALAVFLSILIPDVLSSVGLELFILLLLTVATLWRPALLYTPAGLLTILSEIAAGHEVDIFLPSLSTVVFTVILVVMAIRLFENREL